MELAPDGKEPGCDGGVLVLEDDVAHDGADAVVDTEAGFVPGVEREEDGVGGEYMNTFGERGPD